MIARAFDRLKQSALNRPRGYLDECQRLGKVSADGKLIFFTVAAFVDIRKRFPEKIKTRIDFRAAYEGVTPDPDYVPPTGGGTAPSTKSIQSTTSTPGLGDLVHKFAGPIGQALNWPCMKGNGTTDLRAGSPCDQARAFLNKVKL